MPNRREPSRNLPRISKNSVWNLCSRAGVQYKKKEVFGTVNNYTQSFMKKILNDMLFIKGSRRTFLKKDVRKAVALNFNKIYG